MSAVQYQHNKKPTTSTVGSSLVTQKLRLVRVTKLRAVHAVPEVSSTSGCSGVAWPAVIVQTCASRGCQLGNGSSEHDADSKKLPVMVM